MAALSQQIEELAAEADALRIEIEQEMRALAEQTVASVQEDGLRLEEQGAARHVLPLAVTTDMGPGRRAAASERRYVRLQREGRALAAVTATQRLHQEDLRRWGAGLAAHNSWVRDQVRSFAEQRLAAAPQEDLTETIEHWQRWAHVAQVNRTRVHSWGEATSSAVVRARGRAQAHALAARLYALSAKDTSGAGDDAPALVDGGALAAAAAPGDEAA